MVLCSDPEIFVLDDAKLIKALSSTFFIFKKLSEVLIDCNQIRPLTYPLYRANEYPDQLKFHHHLTLYLNAS